MNRFERLRNWAFPPGVWTKGYWGKLPYLLLLRSMAAIGIWARYRFNTENMPFWTGAAVFIALLSAVFLHTRPRKSYSQLVYIFIICTDIAVISTAYWHTGHVESDLFLLYSLPIFTAAEYLRARWVLAAFLGSTIALFVVVGAMPIHGRYEELKRVETLGRVFLPREFYFVAIATIWALRLQRERDVRESLLQRQTQMSTLLKCREKVDSIFSLDSAFEAVINHLSRGLQAKHVAGALYEAGGLHSRSNYLRAGNTRTLTPLQKTVGHDQVTVERLEENCRRVMRGEPVACAVPIKPFGQVAGAISVEFEKTPEGADQYLTAFAQLAGSAYERASLLHILSEIGDAAAFAIEHNRILESIFDHLLGLGFEYAIISLVQPYTDRIETVRGRNVPNGWIASSQYSLKSKDILSSIVASGKLEVLDGYDDRLNHSIWTSYNHERLARIFAPIIVLRDGQRKVIGVIETGCDKSQRQQLLDPKIDEVRCLGEESGEKIYLSTPTVLLELLATRAIELIGAESASMHVLRDGSPLLVAGVGQIDNQFLKTFDIQRYGITFEDMRSGKRLVHNFRLASEVGPRSLGLKEMAIFGLEVDTNTIGVLCIYFSQDRNFSEAELQLVGAFVPQMRVAIRNHLLIHDFARLETKTWMLTGLQNVLRSLSFEPAVDKILQRLTDDIKFVLDAKNVTLYEYFQSDRKLSRATLAGQFEDKTALTMEVQRAAVVNTVIADGKNLWISDAQNAAILRQAHPESPARPRFFDREKVASCVVLMLRSPYDGEIVGCFFANYGARRDFDSPKADDYKRLAELLAAWTAMAIRSARLHATSLTASEDVIARWKKEVAGLKEIDDLIVKAAGHPNADAVCEAILAQALRVLGSDVTLGDVLLWEPDQKILKVYAHSGFSDRPPDTRLAEGIVGWVAEQRIPAMVGDVSRDKRYRNANEGTRAELTVPILGPQDRLMGVLNVEHVKVDAFSERDKAFLQMLTMQAAIALDIVRLYRELQERAQQALALKMVVTRIQQGGFDRETALRQILVGVTANEGLRFSRAMLFEIRDSGDLCGLTSIGGLTRPNAEKIWSKVGNLDLESLLSHAEKDATTFSDPELQACVRSIQAPVASLPERVRASLASPGSAGVHLVSAELQDHPLAALYQDEDRCDLICVPVWRGKSATALLMADNRFLHNEDLRSSDHDAMLAAFAEVTALTLERLELKSQLAGQEQLENWMEASRRAAHVLQERIINLGNRIKELHADLEIRDLPAARDRIKDLNLDVRDVLDRFDRIRTFAAPRLMNMSRVDLASVLKHTVSTRGRDLKCRILLDIRCEPLFIRGDSESLPTMFIDLFNNADKAMGGRDGSEIRVRAKAEEDHVVIEVEDNGPGIPSEIIGKVFDPYVTKSGGTGLGLPIIKRLVEEHQGKISAGNHSVEGGARFTVRLPISQAN